jgi:hypothetical protein
MRRDASAFGASSSPLMGVHSSWVCILHERVLLDGLLQELVAQGSVGVHCYRLQTTLMSNAKRKGERLM